MQDDNRETEVEPITYVKCVYVKCVLDSCTKRATKMLHLVDRNLFIDLCDDCFDNFLSIKFSLEDLSQLLRMFTWFGRTVPQSTEYEGMVIDELGE